jgi:murein DD-endopeptidase MepM/ murein hydrolase activator NlpD
MIPYLQFAEAANLRGGAVLGRLKSGDSFYSLLKRSGFPSKSVFKLLNKNKKAQNFVLSQDIPYLIKNSRSERKLEFFDPLRPKKIVFWEKNNKVGWAIEPVNFETKTIRFKGHVHGSLIGSIVALSKSELLARDFIDVFRLQLNPESTRRGAQFDILVEKQLINGSFIKFGKIIYAQIKTNKKVLSKRVVEYKDGYVHVGAEDEFYSRPFYLPVSRLRVSSLFQAKRIHPITKKRQAHLGVDFDFPEGENVYSAQSGTVKKVGRARRSGNYVVIRHSNGFESSYNHLSYISPRIKVGSKISAGGLVGFIGTTGQSTRPHLHFGLRKNGRALDPLKYIRNYPAIAETRVKRVVALR